jgi:hypothetical protein
MELRSAFTFVSKASKARVLADFTTLTDSEESESLSITQRLSPPPLAGADESLELEESSEELLDELESSEPAAAQNLDMVIVSY